MLEQEQGRRMIANTTETSIDWMQCELIESVPRRVSGRPTVRGTRILPDPMVNSFELGDTLEEIHEAFPRSRSARSKD